MSDVAAAASLVVWKGRDMMNVWVASQPSLNGEDADRECGPLVVAVAQRDALAASFAVLYEAFIQLNRALAIERVDIDGDRERTVITFVMRCANDECDDVNVDTWELNSIAITRHTLAVGD